MILDHELDQRSAHTIESEESLYWSVDSDDPDSDYNCTLLTNMLRASCALFRFDEKLLKEIIEEVKSETAIDPLNPDHVV